MLVLFIVDFTFGPKIYFLFNFFDHQQIFQKVHLPPQHGARVSTISGKVASRALLTPLFSHSRAVSQKKLQSHFISSTPSNFMTPAGRC